MYKSDLSDSGDDSHVEIGPKPTRSTKKPERYGEAGSFVLSEEDENHDSYERMLSDDSSDEYVAEKATDKKKIVYTTDQSAKRQRTETNFAKNFDSEFDCLNSKRSSSMQETVSISTDADFINGSDGTDADAIPDGYLNGNNTHNGTNSKIIVNTNEVSNHLDKDQSVCKTSQTPKDCSVSEASKADVNHKLLLEMLARVRVIENSLIRNRSLCTINSNMDNGNSFEEFHAFLKSNRLPLQNIDDMKLFEANLCDPEFKKVAVSAYFNIGLFVSIIIQVVKFFLISRNSSYRQKLYPLFLVSAAQKETR